jgi:NADPH-dependent 2,4-dienoyl-CoA reductase/sulfur reductase-like enzyme/rhodanese-related sulfurtransferase
MGEKRILIVGGVAGGASCAARARRLSEEAEIILFERGQYVSFANCGLPYYVGNVIKDQEDLLVASEELFRDRFNIGVRSRNEVIAIDRERSMIKVRDLASGKDYEEGYDALVLAPGAAPIRPPLPGIELDGIFALRTIPDSVRIREWVDRSDAKKAVIVGCGFIGLEMAENLVERGLSVQMIEMAPQVMPPLDPEMAEIVHEHVEAEGVAIHLGDAVSSFEATEGGGKMVRTQKGYSFRADIVILGIGVRPESRLADMAGLQTNDRGGIVVDEQMRTDDPKIWAVGDAVQVRDTINGEWLQMPLAGPANRQGRIAADSILGRSSKFRGVQPTAVCGVMGKVAATTGASEKTLRRLGRAYGKVYLHPRHHVGYYPGAHPIRMKLLYDPNDNGRVLGMQAVGEAGVERRVDVVAAMIQMGGSVFDLEEAELCYAPQFGAAKDPVNMAGMIAANALRGDAQFSHWESLEPGESTLLDVRSKEEFDEGHVPGAKNIDVNELRNRLGEIPKDRPVTAYCEVGQRAYYAQRLLSQNGFQASNLSGGIQTYNLWQRRRIRDAI